MKYRRIYAMLKAFGHDPAKAAEIIHDAQRHDAHALKWVRAVRRVSR